MIALTVKEKVHVLGPDGERRYNRLLDDGGPVLDFAMGWGFITRELVERAGWSIVPGWHDEGEGRDGDGSR